MNLLAMISFLFSFIIIAHTTNAGLQNVGNSCYLNTALQALASVPAVSNLLLSVDSETLTDPRYKSLLLKLQTILYALRDEHVHLSSGYLEEFRDAISNVSHRKWNAGRQEDETEFYRSLLQVIDGHLLPTNKRAAFHSLLYFEETRTTIPPTCSDGVPEDPENVLAIQGWLPDVNSVQKGLAMRFAENVAEARDAILIRQPYIYTPPQVLNIIVNRNRGLDATKVIHEVEIPIKLNINAYKYPHSNWELSPEYELRYIAVHSGTSVNSGHYYGYKYDNSRWIRLDDSSVSISTEDVPAVTSGRTGGSTAYMLHYVNVGKKAELLKVEPVPAKIMAQIDGELARQATLRTRSTSSYHSSNYSSNNSSSGGSGSSSGSSGSSSGSGSSSNSSGNSSTSSSTSTSGIGTSPTTPPSPAPSTTNAPTKASTPKESFSWFGLRNDAISLKPEVIPSSLVLILIMLVVN